MKGVRLLLGLVVLAVLAPLVPADSIWQRRSSRYGFLFYDIRARQIGDQLTVLIAENSAINQREQRQNSKATTASGTVSFEGDSASDNATRTGKFNVKGNDAFNRTFNGQAQFSSSRTFVDRVAVTVIDVLPNGNLVVEGHRHRVISGEKRVLRITGIVRPADITPSNTVPAEAIANFSIEYYGRGFESQYTNPGWWGRIMNVLWPF